MKKKNSRNTMLQIIDNSEIGGAERHTKLITKQFAQLGYRVFFIFPPGPYTPQYLTLKNYGVTCIELNIRENIVHFLKCIWYIHCLIKTESIGLIHSHQYLADFIVTLSLLGLKGPLHFSTVHNIIKYNPGGKFVRFKMGMCSFFAFHRMKKIFTVSNEVKKITQKYFYLNNKKVVVTLNAIDFEDLLCHSKDRIDIKERYSFPGNSKIILSVGVLHRLKGQHLLIEALGLHLKDWPIKLVFVGIGPERENFENLAKKYNIQTSVIFAGLQMNCNPWYCSSDIYVQPTLNDALPRSVLEAMFLKVPVIASNIPTITEVIQDGVTGLLFTPSSSDSLAKQIVNILKQPELSQQLVERAHAFVTKNCSMKMMAEKILRNIEI